MSKIKYAYALFCWVFSSLLGFFLIGWMIFNRLFRVRLPKDIPTEITSYGDVIYFLIFVGALVNCIVIIYSLLKNPNPSTNTSSNNNRLIQWLKQKFTKLGGWAAKFGEWYYNLYQIAYEILVTRLLPIRVRVWLDKKLFDMGYYLFVLLMKKYMLTILLCTEIIPSFIVATFLFIDVYYLGKFQYFYISLYLMIIPITWKVILYMLKEIAESLHINLEKYVLLIPEKYIIRENGLPGWEHKISDQCPKEMVAKYVELNIHSHVILIVLHKIHKIQGEFYRYFLSARLLTGLIFLSSWGLVIYKLMF